MCVDSGWRTFFMEKIMKYSREELNSINLYSLRAYAREIGVKAPTSFRKNELIEEILLVDSGQKPPCKEYKGCPPKKIVATTDNLTTSKIKKEVKRKLIKTILRNIEKKLNKLL